jgi:FkbM family methyltransferase
MNSFKSLVLCAARSRLAPGWVKRSSRRKIRRWLRGQTLLVETSNGVSLEIIVGDDVDNQILFDGVFESHLTQLIHSLAIQGEGYFVDIGCHLGYYSTLVGKSAPEMQIAAFDANPNMVQRCDDNLRRNGIKAEIQNCGVGREAGKLTFTYSRQHPSLGTFGKAPDIVDDLQSMEVEVLPLNALLPQGPIWLIKMDIEGFEYDALSTIDADTAARIENIVLECSADRLSQCGRQQSDFDQLSWLSGYQIFLVEGADSHLPLQSFKEVPDGDQNLWLKKKHS